MKITIECTRDHLTAALLDPTIKESRGTKCWIARAVRDIFPQAAVGQDCIHPVYTMGSLISTPAIPLPTVATKAIGLFDSYLGDHHTPVTRMKTFDLLQPFSFDLEISEQMLNYICQVYNYSLDSVYDILEKSENLTLKSV